MGDGVISSGREMRVSVLGFAGQAVLFHFNRAVINESVDEFDSTTDLDAEAKDFTPGMSEYTIDLGGYLDDAILPEWSGILVTWTCRVLNASNVNMYWSGSGFLRSVTSSLEKTGGAGYDATIRGKGRIDKNPTPTPSITVSPFEV